MTAQGVVYRSSPEITGKQTFGIEVGGPWILIDWV
jgi:hypothetical protein